MPPAIELGPYGLNVRQVSRNASVARLYEHAIARGEAAIASSGALATRSGDKTGRSPKDKRIVEEAGSRADVWWGDVNIPISETSYRINRQRAIDYLNTRDALYVQDGYAGWDPEHRLKVRVIGYSPYHALFMRNMLIRPDRAGLESFGTPDFTIFNAGRFPANRFTAEVGSTTSVDLSFHAGEAVILGTEYAGEMKKGVFTLMNYLMPKKGVLSMHCSANVGASGDCALFFGLSGTGKTTLSADPARRLVGDDEHCWTDSGIFNIEGGCYAKVVRLRAASEPEIYQAIRFGAVLENVVYEEESHEVDYDSTAITENTRAAYPIEFIPNAQIPGIADHPSNVIFLTCDAFGVLPPVSRLSPEQAMYHFMSGYTAKVAGTEMGISAPQATFSACFGAAFLVWHPSKYAGLLADRLRQHEADAWLVNTGWAGGGADSGARRMDLAITRAVVAAIHSGALRDAPTELDPTFGLRVPTECPGVPRSVLLPRELWPDPAAYEAAARKLAAMFRANFAKYEAGADPSIKAAGPAG